MIVKLGKPPEEQGSYRPISLLPTLSKLFEKLLHKRILTMMEKRNIIPEYQFGFRSRHATTEQIVNTIRTAFEEKRHCPGVFLDVKQAFDKVWLEGLIHQISEYLPEQTVQSNAGL